MGSFCRALRTLQNTALPVPNRSGIVEKHVPKSGTEKNRQIFSDFAPRRGVTRCQPVRRWPPGRPTHTHTALHLHICCSLLLCLTAAALLFVPAVAATATAASPGLRRHSAPGPPCWRCSGSCVLLPSSKQVRVALRLLLAPCSACSPFFAIYVYMVNFGGTGFSSSLH
jgi:hypothetical protein